MSSTSTNSAKQQLKISSMFKIRAKKDERRSQKTIAKRTRSERAKSNWRPPKHEKKDYTVGPTNHSVISKPAMCTDPNTICRLLRHLNAQTGDYEAKWYYNHPWQLTDLETNFVVMRLDPPIPDFLELDYDTYRELQAKGFGIALYTTLAAVIIRTEEHEEHQDVFTEYTNGVPHRCVKLENADFFKT